MEEISQLLTQEFSYQKKKKKKIVDEKNGLLEVKFIYLKEPEVRIYQNWKKFKTYET